MNTSPNGKSLRSRTGEQNARKNEPKQKRPSKVKYMYERRQQKEAKRENKVCPRDTWNVDMLNKVLVKLARKKPNNPNVREKTRNASYNG